MTIALTGPSLPPPTPATFDNFIPLPTPLLPPSFNSFQTNFQGLPSPLPSSPLLLLPRQIPRPRPRATQNQPTTHFREMAMIKTKPEKEQILENIDTDIYEIPDAPKIEIGDPLLNFLSTDAEDILVNDYVNGEELQDRAIEKINEEYKFEEIKDAFDEGKIPPQLEFFLEAFNFQLFLTFNFLSLSEHNNELVSFLGSDMGQNIMTNNSLSIHLEVGDIFYNNFNTKEHFYNFLQAQQDGLKQFIPKRLSDHYSFEKYTRSYLPSFSLKEIDKLDLLCHQIKTQHICCTNLMTGLNPRVQKKL